MPWLGSTMHPMAFPTPALVGIADTNALAARACNAASRFVAEELFTGLAATGRSNTFVSAHVPGELDDHLAEVAAHYPGLMLPDAERVLWGQVMPRVPVVDLAVGDYLHPRVRALMQADPALPRSMRGDPDDVGTAALAEFLAPSVIISADSVFTRFGLANTVATTWLPAAHMLLKAAGFEATLTETAHLLEFSVRIGVALFNGAASVARRYPLPAAGLLAGAAYVAWRSGHLSNERRRVVCRQLRRAGSDGLRMIDSAFSAYGHARGVLLVVEPYGVPTVEQIAARHLARVGRPLMLPELTAALIGEGYPVTSEELEQATSRHPAFWGSSHSWIGIGKRARRYRLTSDPQLLRAGEQPLSSTFGRPKVGVQTLMDRSPVQINHEQLDEILADFSAFGKATHLDDPILDFGYAATEKDDLGIPLFSPELPRIPVALVERHQALWTHPDNDTPQQEVWTELALSHGMQRIGDHGVHQLPNLDGWLIAEWPRDGGLQLQQPDGNLFVYALCEVPPTWIAAARQHQWVLVLHGPNLGLRVPLGRTNAEHLRRIELATARKEGLVTGGLMRWGRIRTP
jgi:hypothetical protein